MVGWVTEEPADHLLDAWLAVECQGVVILTCKFCNSNVCHKDPGSPEVALINAQILSLTSGGSATSRKAQAVLEKPSGVEDDAVVHKCWRKDKLSHLSLSPSVARLLWWITNMFAINSCVTKPCFLCDKFCFPYRSAFMWLWLRCPHGCVDPCFMGEGPGTFLLHSPPSTQSPGTSLAAPSSLIVLGLAGAGT